MVFCAGIIEAHTEEMFEIFNLTIRSVDIYIQLPIKPAPKIRFADL